MATFAMHQYVNIPSVHQKFERKTVYIVGYNRAAGFIRVGQYDVYEDAVSRAVSENDYHPERQYHIVEMRTELFLLL